MSADTKAPAPDNRRPELVNEYGLLSLANGVIEARKALSKAKQAAKEADDRLLAAANAVTEAETALQWQSTLRNNGTLNIPIISGDRMRKDVIVRVAPLSHSTTPEKCQHIYIEELHNIK